MSQRFFVESPIVSDQAELTDSEAHHLLHVMRAAVGDEVTLFDGSGAEFTARVRQLKRSVVFCDVIERHEMDRELPWPVVLGVALPKGDRQKWLVEKATELGVTQIVPLETSRGVAQPEASALDRLRRSVIEASKQCGRNRLLVISPPQPLATFAREAPASAHRWLAHPATNSPAANIAAAANNAAHWLAVGPEGGFTDQEVADTLSHGWQAVDLGRRILRVETAAVALATLAAHGR